MAKQSIYPPPVYVATFADGTTCRMSFWSQAGKPFNFERGRRLCAQAISNERARLASSSRYSSATLVPKLIGKPFLSKHERCREPLGSVFDAVARGTWPSGHFALYMSGRKLIGMSGSLLDRGLARWSEPTVVAPVGCMPAEDIIAGHVEYDDVTYLDPHFLPKPVPVIVQRTKRRAVAIDDALSVVAAYFGLADPNADELAGLRAAFAAKAAA